MNRATSGRSGALGDFLSAIGTWIDGPGPLFRRLSRAVASAVERGALPQGSRVPSERDVAVALSIGRGTAVAAYELLVADGLLERRRGSGTYVSISDQPLLPPGREGSALVHRLVERSEPRSVLLDLSLSVLHDAEGLPPVSVSTSDLVGLLPATGYNPWGLPELRRSVAEHITWWGLDTSEDQVIITTGAQQAISAAATCWVRPGDTVVVDDPTYPGSLASFVQAGARLEGVPVDRYGVLPDALLASLDRRPALVYLQTGVHSPTGTVLSESRRRQLAGILSRYSVPVVEDLALCDLAWSIMPRPLAAEVPRASTVVVGSLSKLFWGGIRVGFVRAPEPLSLRFARIKGTHDLGTSVVSQLLAHRLLRSAPPDQLRARQTVQLRRRYEVLAAALRRQLPRWTWREPSGGLSIWVEIEGSGEAFAQHATRYGVLVASPAALSLSPGHANHLRLSFSSPPDQLEEAVAQLHAAYRTWRS